MTKMTIKIRKTLNNVKLKELKSKFPNYFSKFNVILVKLFTPGARPLTVNDRISLHSRITPPPLPKTHFDK